MRNSTKELAVVFIGHGSEYVFGGLVARLRSAGFNCFELNMAMGGWRDFATQALCFSERVLFTSQHPYVNRFAWLKYYGYDEDIISLPEAIDLISPRDVYYLPHDLSCPIKQEEIFALSYVTAALMPDDTYWHLNGLAKIYNAGWIGQLAAIDCAHSSEHHSVVFLPSEIAYYKKVGFQHFLDTFDALLKENIIVKFPILDGVDVFERELLDRGVKVSSSFLSASEVIESSSVVISNGLSSVIAEAVLQNKNVICLLDGVHKESVQRDFFASPSNPILFCYPSSVQVAINEFSVVNSDLADNRIKPFDFDLVLRLLTR